MRAEDKERPAITRSCAVLRGDAMCVSTPTLMRLPVFYAYGSKTYTPFPLSPPPSDRPWQSPPEAPDDRLTNVQGLLLDPVNSLRDTAATVRPGRVVHHSFSVDGETSPHCRPRGWLARTYEERIQSVT